MMYRNSQFKANGYKVKGYKVSHHHDAKCTECAKVKEVATIWNRRGDDINYNDICRDCAEIVGHELA